MTDVAAALAAINELMDKYLKVEEEKEALEAQVTEKNKELAVMLGQVTAYLKEAGMESYDSPIAKATIQQKWRVSLPKDDMAKTALFEHLRERGIFDRYATVNSNSLNALYMADWAAAQDRGEGMEFSMPGIEPAKVFETSKIDFKRGKKRA